MTTSVVNFEFPFKTGKKRKRMPGTNKDRKPEVKQCSMLNTNSSSDSIFSHYKFLNPWGIWSTNDFAGSWLPIFVQQPDLGDQCFQRIGNHYFIKYFYLKGYIAEYANCVNPMRWRFRLIRVTDDSPFLDPDAEDGGGGYLTLDKQYELVNTYLRSIYRNPRLVVKSNSDAATRMDHLRKTFYMGMRNNRSTNITSKIIASGLVGNTARLNFTSMRPEGGTISKGIEVNNLGLNHSPRYKYSYTPFGVKVTVNDCIRFTHVTETDGSLSEKPQTTYWLALETDFPLAVRINMPGENSDTYGGFQQFDRTTTGPNAADFPCFEISIQTIQYFTDD